MNKKTATRSAYSLLRLEKDREEETVRALRRLRNVGEAHQVYGIYDGILYAEASADTQTGAMDALKHTLVDELKRNGNVKNSLVSVVVRDKDGKPIGFKKDLKTEKITYENIPDDIF